MNATQRRTLFLLMIAVGAAMVLVGAVLKIKAWPYANVLLGVGVLLEIAAALGLTIAGLRKISR